MRIQINRFFVVLITVSVLSGSCKQELINIDKNYFLSDWIFTEMQSVYLWNSTLPGAVNLEAQNDPKVFFYSLLYGEEDKWSWITDDLPSLEAELEGTPLSMGYSAVFFKYFANDNICAVVDFVYPGSPADDAGLKRGDIIITINGDQLNTYNYEELINLPSYSAGLGIMEDDIINSRDTAVSMTAKVINANPVVYFDTLNINGIKTGYVVYTNFIQGKNGIYLSMIGNILDQFKASGVTDLILDLRCNRGGETEAAAFLASAIVPSHVVSSGRIFARFNYNADIQSYIRNNEGPNSDKLVLRFPESQHSMDLSKIHILTGPRTASASELLIIGLEPYMDVISIGENTYGKYTGMWVIKDYMFPARHNYGLIPVVNRFSNAFGYTNFKEGLIPDHHIEEDIFQLKPFGDPDDPLLARAKEIISGIYATGTKKAEKHTAFIPVIPERDRLKSNLFVRPF